MIYIEEYYRVRANGQIELVCAHWRRLPCK